MRRKHLIAAVVALVIMATTACSSSGHPAGPLPAGPLAAGDSVVPGKGGNECVHLLRPGRTGTITIFNLPADTVLKPTAVQSVRLVNANDLGLIQAVFVPNGEGQIGTGRGYPPKLTGSGPDTVAWRNKLLASGAELQPGTEYDLVVGVRLGPGATAGRSSYVRIEYSQSGHSYSFGTPLGARLTYSSGAC